MTIVYKRTNNEDGKHYSAFITGKLCLEYQLNEWTEPEVGKLFAFETEEQARGFYIGNELWAAEAEGVELFHAPIFMVDLDTIHRYVKSFWKKRYEFLKGKGRLNRPPAGTILCSRIKLLKEI